MEIKHNEVKDKIYKIYVGFGSEVEKGSSFT